ncbi:MAG: hypothetical protein SynsKO_10290 [Synoicihabitans sp.]
MSLAPSETPSPVVRAAAQSNIMLLAQGAELIDRLGAASYGVKIARCFNSSAGGHFRHTIEHYRALLAALNSGEVDYEGRARDERIETDAAHARGIIDELRLGFEKMVTDELPDRPLLVKAETVTGHQLKTSLARELEFLISHTVHHYALIAVIAGAQDVVPPPNFGMAPSTLKHLQTPSIACAH